jgi:hypothetical protein
MAADTGVRQGSFSNVLTGKREPGMDMVAKVAAHPLVNPNWLFTGEGIALVENVANMALGEAAVYVARELFEGLPDDNRDKLEGYLLPVHRVLHRASRYWVSVTRGHPLLDVPVLAIAERDIVLFEPDAKGWPANIHSHPCIVRIGRGRGTQLGFAIASVSDTGSTTFRLLGSLTRPNTELAMETNRYWKPLLAIEFSDEETQKDASVKRTKARARAQSIKPVAIGIYREGRFGHD